MKAQVTGLRSQGPNLPATGEECGELPPSPRAPVPTMPAN
jgi:hypothetical protein